MSVRDRDLSKAISHALRHEPWVYELDDDRIRALYGHSLPGRLKRLPAAPPDCLLHGTSRDAVDAILRTGLKPMGRQYVHLSVDVETAQAVGSRKDSAPVLLRVSASRAHGAGVTFYVGNEKVWLADDVPAEYLEVVALVHG